MNTDEKLDSNKNAFLALARFQSFKIKRLLAKAMIMYTLE